MFEQAPLVKHLSIDEAELYVMTLAHNNKYDWRLPTIPELKTIPMNDRPVCWHQHDLVGAPVDMQCGVIAVRTIND